MELEAVVSEGLKGSLVALLNECLDLGVDVACGAFRAGDLVDAAQVAIAALAEGHHAEALGHAELRDHRPCDLGRLLDVAGRARGHLTEDELLGRPAPAEYGQPLLVLLARREVVLVLLGLHREAQRP